MSNVTANTRRPYNGGIRPLEIFIGLLGANVEAFQGAVLGKRADGYYENAGAGAHRELAIVRKYADNRGGNNGAVSVELERGVHAYDTWTGTIDQRHVGNDAVCSDNQTIACWDPAALPTAVAVGDANCMTLQGLQPGTTYKIIREGNSKPLTFRIDKPGEVTISLKTDNAGATDSTMTGTAVSAAVNASPIAGPLLRGAAAGTGASVVPDVTTAADASLPRLGEIVAVDATTVYVDSTK